MCKSVRAWRTLGGFLAVLSIVLLSAAIGVSPAQAAWPTPPQVFYGAPSHSLAIDSLDNLYTASYDSGSISKIDATGTLVEDWAHAVLGDSPPGAADVHPNWITVDDANNVITGGDNGVLVKYLPTGTLDPNFAAGGILTLPIPHGSDYPPDIFFVVTDHAGNIYTANNGNGTVSKISPTGIVDWTAVASSTQGGTISVAVDAQGNVYAANSSEDTLWKILPAGTLAGGMWPVTVGHNPKYITLDAQGNIYVPNATDGTVSKILPNGTAADGPWPAHLGLSSVYSVYSIPTLVTIDAAGSLYATNFVTYLLDSDGNPVYDGWVSKILSDGTVVTDEWPRRTRGLTYSLGAVIDSSGNLFVDSFGEGFVTKFAGATAPAPPIVPDAPSAVLEKESATVTITPNALTAQHGTPTSYTITTAIDTSKQCTITLPATSCVIDHLAAGTTYTFNAKANLLTWQTAASAASNAVTTAEAPKPAALVIRVNHKHVGAQSNSITISFTAPGPGAASLTGTIVGQRASNGSVKVCSAKKTVKKAGKVTMTCRLNAKGKALRQQHALRVVLTVTFTPTGGTASSANRSVTFALTNAVKPKPSTTPSNVTG